MMDCEHKNATMKKFHFEKNDGSKCFHITMQCDYCGQRLGKWLPRVEHWEELPLFDFIKERSGQEMLINDAKDKRNSERIKRHIEYEEYLQSAEWTKTRWLVLDRCHAVCECCLAKEATHVHHRNYDSIYHEYCFDLIGVCKECHERIHNNY